MLRMKNRISGIKLALVKTMRNINASRIAAEAAANVTQAVAANTSQSANDAYERGVRDGIQEEAARHAALGGNGGKFLELNILLMYS